MLLVDEVNVIGDNLVKGSYQVKGDEFFLQGHFPEIQLCLELSFVKLWRSLPVC
jgi:hypothetical protein